jgi:hypothetical protein
MAKRTSGRHSAKAADKGVDYTVTGLVVLIAVVVLTALFFSQRTSCMNGVSVDGNIGGQAISTGSDAAPAKVCDVSSFCDGSRLVRQGADCAQYEAFCTYGCGYSSGHAYCLSG